MQEMESPEFFSIAEGYGRFCPQGQMSLQEAVALVTRAIVFCRDNKIPKLLVDVTRLTGFPSPSVVDRYWFVREWAGEARGSVSAAMVARPEFIDPEKFGVMVAANAGWRCDVFASEQQALEWLLKGKQG